MIECTAVLMAGGKSTRMGMEKAFLDCQGVPLWRIQLEKLTQFAHEVLVSAKSDFPLPINGEYTLVVDEVPELGPLGGLASVLDQATHQRVLVLAVDMPRMTSKFLSEITVMASSECGVIPEWAGYYQGLAAVYPQKILPLVHEVLTGNDHSFQCLNKLAIAEGLMRVHRVAESEGELFKNWNAPRDLWK